MTASVIQHFANGVGEIGFGEGLLQAHVVLGEKLFHSDVTVGVARHEYHLQVRLDLRQSLHEIRSRRPGHDHVCQDEINRVGSLSAHCVLEDMARFPGGGGREDRVPETAENAGYQDPDHFLVFDEKDRLGPVGGVLGVAGFDVLRLSRLLINNREVYAKRRSRA